MTTTTRLRRELAVPLRPVVRLEPIVLPLERLEVGEFIAAAVRDGTNVVDLPAHLRRLAVVVVGDQHAATVLADHCSIVAGYDLRLLPDVDDVVDSEAVA